jgi:hypothetical protein
MEAKRRWAEEKMRESKTTSLNMDFDVLFCRSAGVEAFHYKLFCTSTRLPEFGLVLNGIKFNYKLRLVFQLKAVYRQKESQNGCFLPPNLIK